MNSSKTVLITGSTRGIGLAVAKRLAADGYAVVVHGRSIEKARAAAESIAAAGGAARAIAFDVTDREAAARALEADIEEFGAYWGIILNAGIHDDVPLVGMEPETWDKVIDADLNSFYNVLRPSLMPTIRKRRGRVLVVSSISGIIGTRGQTNYSAAKAGLIGAAKALGAEVAAKGVTVNVLAPGLIDTDMPDEEAKERIAPMIPMRRAGRPEEVAAAAAFFMSEESSYITRAVLPISGGL